MEQEAPPARVDSALRRGRVVALAEVSAAVVTTGVLDLLWRSRHRLYSASLALDEEAGLVRDSTGLRSPMAVVAGLQRLRILRLNEHSIAYGGELKDCAPALFHLDVRKWTSSALVTHVLNGAADTLRIVSVEDPPVALSAEQLQYFARCKHLWRLTLMHVPDHQNLRCLEAVRGSQSLHELCVSFRGPQEPLHTAHSILDTLALCRTMPALKYVSFRSDVNFHGSPPVLVSLYKRVYRKISAAFEHFRPDVEVDVFTHTA